MRLFLIDKPECRHISKIMDGVKAVYQMEQEFSPYLTVDFLPNHNNDPGGIIIQVGNEIIRKNYTFENKNDIINLRKLLWELVRKYHNPTDITDKNGCIKNFNVVPKTHVIQGWKNALRARPDTCCKVIIELLTDELTDKMIKHWVYRDSNKNIQDRNICKKVRGEECGNNYAPNSPQFRHCVREVNWVCNNGYPKNNNTRVNNVNQIVKEVKTKIYKYLDKNDMKVNKRIFDDIITAGLFDYVGNRMGNKSRNIYNVKNSVRDALYEKGIYMKLIEDFKGNNPSQSYSNIVCIIILIIIVIYIYYGFI